jgi:hypothetical protein
MIEDDDHCIILSRLITFLQPNHYVKIANSDHLRTKRLNSAHKN